MVVAIVVVVRVVAFPVWFDDYKDTTDPGTVVHLGSLTIGENKKRRLQHNHCIHKGLIRNNRWSTAHLMAVHNGRCHLFRITMDKIPVYLIGGKIHLLVIIDPNGLSLCNTYMHIYRTP